MKISEKFNLNMSQNELDFVDIDISTDMQLFIDPYRISKLYGPFVDEINDTIRNYFSYLTELLSTKQYDEARKIFIHLGEVNETCLGFSSNQPRGAGLGNKNLSDIFEAMKNSVAVKNGILNSIEDIRVFVDGVDIDRISDMTTNIIRKSLINYTRNQCELYNIPLMNDIPSGFFWNPSKRQWEQEHMKMLVIDDKKYILVPKIIVTYGDKITSKDYFQHFVLNFFQSENIRKNTNLVQKRIGKKNKGTPFVTKKDIKEKQLGGGETPFKPDKDWLAGFTKAHAGVFAKFKDESFSKMKSVNFSENRIDIAIYLIESLKNIELGPKGANDYHNLMICILEFIFYPNLSNPKKETPINDNRKRIDITYNNTAEKGFFFELFEKYNISAYFIMAECKNYSVDISNPELDQLMGRFSNRRGRFGLSLSRKVDDYNKLIKRCSDILKDGNGLIIPIFDNDIINILEDIKNGNENNGLNLLLERYTEISLQ